MGHQKNQLNCNYQPDPVHNTQPENHIMIQDFRKEKYNLYFNVKASKVLRTYELEYIHIYTSHKKEEEKNQEAQNNREFFINYSKEQKRKKTTTFYSRY